KTTSWRATPERGSSRGPSSSAIFPFSFRRLFAGRLFRSAIWLNRHHVPFLHCMIISPEQMGSHASLRPPGLGHFRQDLGIRPLAQTEGNPCRFLNREVARGKRIGMAETEQQINIGGPRADPMQRSECRMGLVRVHVPDCCEIDTAFGDG